MTTTLEKPGTFLKPGPIGRTVRLLLGIFLLFTTTNMAYMGYPGLGTVDPTFWLGVAVSFYFLRDAIDGGFALSWGRWLQAVVVVLAVGAVAFDLLLYGSVWEPLFGLLIYWFSVVVLGYLGLTFTLQGIFATPGCEVRTIHHLIGRLLGRETAEYRCVLFARLDEWEARRRGDEGEKEQRETGHYN